MRRLHGDHLLLRTPLSGSCYPLRRLESRLVDRLPRLDQAIPRGDSNEYPYCFSQTRDKALLNKIVRKKVDCSLHPTSRTILFSSPGVRTWFSAWSRPLRHNRSPSPGFSRRGRSLVERFPSCAYEYYRTTAHFKADFRVFNGIAALEIAWVYRICSDSGGGYSEFRSSQIESYQRRNRTD